MASKFESDTVLTLKEAPSILETLIKSSDTTVVRSDAQREEPPNQSVSCSVAWAKVKFL